MTDGPKRDAAAVRIFPPLIPLIVVLAGLLLDWLWPISADIGSSSLRWWLGGAIIAGAVLVFGFWAIRTMRRTGQSENPFKPTTEIVASGPYQITRNPMYLQMVLVCIGLAIGLANVWVLVLTPVGAIALQRLVILPEEAYLEAKFGEGYLAYKRRVRRWI